MLNFIKLIFILLISVPAIAFSKDSSDSNIKEAVFAGGCFWCLESDFEYMQQHNKLSHGGIVNVVSGYDGGTLKDPTYRIVSAGGSGYKEVIQVTYDSTKISYQELVEYFLRRIDPTDDAGQFCDKGDQYKSAIYYTTDEQKQIATNTIAKLKETFAEHNEKVYTSIIASTHFYPAESYHQNYHHKNPKRYCYYRTGCKRDNTINNVWNDVNWSYSNVVPFDVPSSYAACLNR